MSKAETRAAPITADPLRCGGRPCVRDLRISLADVLGWLAQGQTADQIVADYPELTPEDIRTCLNYAAERESGPFSEPIPRARLTKQPN
jgi:uncharacterized protein (DUF433 family)